MVANSLYDGCIIISLIWGVRLMLRQSADSGWLRDGFHSESSINSWSRATASKAMAQCFTHFVYLGSGKIPWVKRPCQPMATEPPGSCSWCNESDLVRRCLSPWHNARLDQALQGHGMAFLLKHRSAKLGIMRKTKAVEIHQTSKTARRSIAAKRTSTK